MQLSERAQKNDEQSSEAQDPMEKKAMESDSSWTLAYYRIYFEVTTDEVLTRLFWSMFPKPGVNFFKDFIRSGPDLYGPIWITLTLIFTVTMSGNLGSYLRSATYSDKEFSWKYDFHLISLAATCILCYCWFVPLLLWSAVKWSSNQQVKVTYLELTCVYGYCATIFIPVSVLWVLQIDWLQWSLAIIATFLSGTVLLKSVVPMTGIKNYFFIFAIFCSHFLLSLSLLWNCFQGSQSKVSSITTVAPT